MFADTAFRERVRLSAMNSINWARVMAQVVYYVTTTARLGRSSFTVPSGNFGNIFAVWVAERTGLPRSEEHTSELQSLMRISYAVFCLKKKTLPTKKI